MNTVNAQKLSLLLNLLRRYPSITGHRSQGDRSLSKQFFFQCQANFGRGPVAALPRPCSRPGRSARAGSPFAAPPLRDFPAPRKKNCLPSLTVYHFQTQGRHDALSLSGRWLPKGRHRSKPPGTENHVPESQFGGGTRFAFPPSNGHREDPVALPPFLGRGVPPRPSTKGAAPPWIPLRAAPRGKPRGIIAARDIRSGSLRFLKAERRMILGSIYIPAILHSQTALVI
jgi:hypothetical protein